MKIIKNTVLKFVNAPESGILSSQTLYECMFYLLNIHSLSPSNDNAVNAKKVAYKIVETQLDNGGFDLGYDFIFGKGLNKKNPKEGTSPELLSITALSQYLLVFGDDQYVLNAIKRGLNWIFDRIIKEGDLYAIPYAPDSYGKVHITNATSFCISALASCLPHVDANNKVLIEKYLDSMYLFMEKQLVDSGDNQAYWPYFYQNGTEEELSYTNDKVDNYHMAQQIYHHMLAQSIYPNKANEKTIKKVFNHLASLINDDGFIPYTFSNGKNTDKVDVWGFSSLISAFSLYGHMHDSGLAKQCSKKILSYLMKNSWNGIYFTPIILHSNKHKFDQNFYPRSDAWVIHAISDHMRFVEEDINLISEVEKVYCLIEQGQFSGLENHTITLRKRIFSIIVNMIRR